MEDSNHQEQRNCAHGIDTMPSDPVEREIHFKNKLDQCRQELKYLGLENSSLVLALKNERKRSALLQSGYSRVLLYFDKTQKELMK